jgi:hypothetical protein
VSVAKDNQATPGVVSFIKIAAFWFILLHVSTIVLNSAGVSSKFLPHYAVGGFAIHSLLGIFSLMTAGSLSRFLLVILACLIGGFGIFGSGAITRAMNIADTRDFLADATTDLAGTLTGANRAFRRMSPVEHLAEAAKLIFEEESTESLELAQRHLRNITAGTPQYPGARRLLEVARNQAEEFENANKPAGDAPVIQILRRERKNDALVITLRNNGKKPVRNIAYHISYFEARTGEPVGDDMQSRISNVLNPQETRTFEVPTSVAGTARAAFSLVGWEVDAGS